MTFPRRRYDLDVASKEAATYPDNLTVKVVVVAVAGKIIQFDSIKGFGFARPDTGGEDVFLHVNDLDFDKSLVHLGTRVAFSVEEGQRGLRASQIRLLEPIPDREAAASDSHGDPQPEVEDDSLCDVLSTAEFVAEVTETLLHAAPGISAEYIVHIRHRLTQLAHSHGWVEA